MYFIEHYKTVWFLHIDTFVHVYTSDTEFNIINIEYQNISVLINFKASYKVKI